MTGHGGAILSMALDETTQVRGARACYVVTWHVISGRAAAAGWPAHHLPVVRATPQNDMHVRVCRSCTAAAWTPACGCGT
jgi:hypothetical protein